MFVKAARESQTEQREVEQRKRSKQTAKQAGSALDRTRRENGAADCGRLQFSSRALTVRALRNSVDEDRRCTTDEETKGGNKSPEQDVHY